MKKTDKIKNKHDKLFAKTFAGTANTKAFLEMALPEMFLNVVDLSKR